MTLSWVGMISALSANLTPATILNNWRDVLKTWEGASGAFSASELPIALLRWLVIVFDPAERLTTLE